MSVASNTVEEVSPGVFLLRFPKAELIDARYCEHLVPPLIAGSQTGAIVLLVDLPENARLIVPNMAPFWLEVFTKRGVSVKGIAVLTTSRAVKVVLNGVALAMRVQGKPVSVTTVPTKPELLAWSKTIT